MRRASSVLFALMVGACATSKPAEKPFELPAVPAGTLTVGLIVSSGTATAQEQADALALFVQRATARPARAILFPDYDTLAAFIAEGKIDAAYLAPMAYVRATSLGQVAPLAKAIRTGQPTHRAVLFGPAGSKLKSLEDLRKGRELKVAWVDPSSATGYVLAKSLLLQGKIDPAGIFMEQSFLKTHDEVCRAVAEGRFDVGASYSIDPAGEPVKHVTGCKTALGERAEALQLIAASESMPNDVLAVKDAFPADARAALAAAALGLAKAPEGSKTLAAAFHAEGFVEVADADYAPVRAALAAFKQ